MEPSFRVKLLWLLCDRKQQGFTLLEILIVFVLMGILSAIALPSFLGQANKAKQAEARLYLGSMNRAQQVYVMEQGQFTSSLDKLGISLNSQTSHYQYTARLSNQPDSQNYVVHQADSLHPNLRPYSGMVAVVTEATGETLSVSILCEADSPSKGSAASPIYGTSLSCSSGTRVLK